MDGPRGHYDKCSKSDREGQTPYGFTYMWNLKNKVNRETKLKQNYKYRDQTAVCQRGQG